MRFFLYTTLIIFNIPVFAQVSADFSLPAEVCLQEQVEPINNSINSTNYQWDFCTGDFNLTPASELFVSDIDYKTNNNISIYFDSKFDTLRYVFFPSGGAKKVFRFKMDDKLSQTFNSEELDLGSVSLGRPIDISIIKVDENYFGYLVDFNTNKLHEINFGENIENQPISVTDLGSFGSLNQPIAVKAIKEGGDIKIVIANYNSTNLTIVNKDLDGIYTHENFNTGSNRGSDIDVLKVNGNVYGLMSFATIGKVRVYNFGSAINSSPSLLIDYSNGAMPSPNNAKWIFESGKVKALVQSNNGNIGLMKMADDFLSVSAYLNYGNFGVLDNSTRGLSVHQNIHSEWHALVPTINTNIYKINFDNSCDVSPGLSTDENPLTSYFFSGPYPITLTASDGNGNMASITKDINVNTGTAPTGDILLDSAYCITNNIIFSIETTDNIESYLWDFGDGNNSVEVSPSHQYINAGNYMITLEIEDDPGCTNTYTRMVEIADEPSTGFSTAKTEYCTFETIDFINTTSGDFGENVNWNWDFNGEGSSTEENPDFTFENSGTKTVTLEADVLGCVQTYQFDLEIIEGPEVDFSFNSNCLGEAVQFTNLSIGANITGYQWNFGNGESSTAENPQVVYNNGGIYEVALTVTNDSGCEITFTQNIQIFEQVVDSIYSTEAIENLPFNLGIDWVNDFDSTQNLSYQWEINSEIQTSDTGTYTLGQGTYTVNLGVITENNCLFTAQRILEVQASENPIPAFNLVSEVCLGEQFQLGNSSINANSYEWDFCLNDLTADSINVEETIDNSNFDVPIGSSLINLKGEWFAFIVNEGDNSITRLSFGEDLNINPTLENLGNYGGELDGPQDIKAIEFEDGLYLFVSNRRTNKFVRINVGEDINNIEPSTDVLLTGDQDIFNNGVDVVYDGSNFIAIYTASNFLRLINLRNDPGNSPAEEDIIRTTNLNNITDIGDISFYRKNNNWYALAVGYSSRTVIRLDFGPSLFTPPSTALIVNSTQLDGNGPYSINLLEEAEMIYAYASTASGALFKLTFNDDILNTPVVANLGKFGLLNRTFKTDLIKYRSRYFGISTDFNSNKVYYLDFQQECSSSIDFSNLENPTNSYSQPGTYPITLTAYHPNGTSESITKEITVSNNQAPDVNFSTGINLCITNPIQFESNRSGDITSYNWDLGDGSSSTVENPSHTYASAGTYEVNLRVTDVNGCNNFYQQSVNVYEQPVPDFQATAQGNLCSQKPIVFENLTTLPTEAEFSWDLGDGTNSAEENPEHVYEEAGEYIITQNISMAGCVVQKTKTIRVSPGPSVKFQTVNNCLGEIVQFENTSEGDFLDTYAWDFGDGTKSTQTNPSHSYDTAGVYQVQLSAFTTNGCDFTLTQEVEIQPVALVTFDSEVSCASKPTQFAESVDIDEANITDYLWDFGVAGTQSDIATEANPEYSFPAAGNYNVRLQVTTSDGCTSVGSQIITVEEVPNAEFQSSNNCIGGVREFTPVDTMNSVNHFWELQNEAGEVISSSDSVNFAFAFTEAGIYQLSYRQQNDNLCSETSFQNIIINDLPNPDFTWGDACAGKTVVFENQTDLKGNIAQSYSWFKEDEIISTDMNPALSFEENGQYQIRLEVKTEGGCRESIEKTINISSSPTADFDIEQTVGALPFTLDLRVDSIANQHYYWVLDVDTISNSVELNHTVAKTGTYLLGLIVRNEAGCTDEYYQQIKVREPSVDISLSNLSVDSDQELTEFVLNISNRGSLVPETIDLTIDLGSYSVTERVEAPIYPERNRNYSLSLKLTEEQKRGLSKICIEAFAEAEGLIDTNTINNRICTNLEGGFKVMDIYPNPTFNKFTVPLIIPENKVMTIRMDDSNGRQVKVFNYNLEAGYNEIVMHRENVSAGIYFLRFSYQGEEKIKKIIFQ